jgi:uncharacterized protein YdeI (YjbR/CyaY-like superfamily)
MMDVFAMLELDNPEDFRQWLQANHKAADEVWLAFYKKASGKQTLSIVQAVEEALCYGWIQSRLKPLDPERFAVRFSPRRDGSQWSLPNLKRARRLIEQGRMTEAGMVALPPEFVKI